MGFSPAAEVVINEERVRTLVRAQLPGSAGLPLRRVASGWDNDLWRLGDELVVRIPRRAQAASLVVGEATMLPRITSKRVPSVVLLGTAGAGIPWPWLVQRWIPGESAATVPRDRRTAWASTLAETFTAVHATDTSGAPRNPYRDGTLRSREAAFRGRLATLADADATVLAAAFDDGLHAPAHVGAKTLLHGDPHPGNMIVAAGSLAALIDFGDVCAGDPAVDLAAGWLVFNAAGRSAFRAALPANDATWRRARGWAAVIASALLATSDDTPELKRCGVETVQAIDAD